MSDSSKHPACIAPSDNDMKLLLAANSHLGSKLCETRMSSYVWNRRADGIHIINLMKTWEKIVFAARAIAAVENPSDVCVISARPYGQRAAHKFAQYTGAQAIANRFTPGTFTNYITRGFKEPRLIIVTDPRTDHQAIRESSYVNIPTIALCDTDSPLAYVDVAIPANNKAKHSIGLVYWLLAREVLRIRGVLPREQSWDVMPDMFFFRDPEDPTEKEEIEDAGENDQFEERDLSEYTTLNARQPSTFDGTDAAAGEGWEAAAETPQGEWAAQQ